MADDGVTVRDATEADLAAISRIRVQSWQAGYAGLLPASLLDGLSATADLDRRRRLFAQLSDRVGSLVAEVRTDAGPTVIGFANLGGLRLSGAPLETCELSTSEGEVYALYVDPQHWRAGAGGALVRACLAWLVERGFGIVRIWVLKGNERARRCYESGGLRLDGEERMFSAGGVEVPEVRYALSAT